MGTDLEVEDFKLKMELLAIKISENNFEDRPEYLNIPTHNLLLDQKYISILEKLKNITKYCIVSPLEILYKYKYELKNNISKEKDKCSICQLEFYEEILEEYEKNPDNIGIFENIPFDVILLDKCADHFFHLECLGGLIGDKTSFKCPNCSRIYGVLMGNMPYGTFNAFISNSKCSGFNCNTITIKYNIPSGPGFSGTSRISYLPNNKEGREILALLKVAFDRKLTFTVGTSITTGKTNTVVWNGIPHKTSLVGGPTRYGYPDDSYFKTVKEVLASKGVTQESIGRDLESISKEILKEH